MLAVFGGFALLIACIGLYGVTSFAVARRRAEVGVRLALGAQPPQILWMVLRQVMALAAMGLAAGLFAAYWVGPVVDSMLYGLEPTDLPTFVGAGLVMLMVALAAGWLPALRASRTDALIALSRD
jgi:ABC-type antimicrobial peptide transport system permease subunit